MVYLKSIDVVLDVKATRQMKLIYLYLGTLCVFCFNE